MPGEIVNQVENQPIEHHHPQPTQAAPQIGREQSRYNLDGKHEQNRPLESRPRDFSTLPQCSPQPDAQDKSA